MMYYLCCNIQWQAENGYYSMRLGSTIACYCTEHKNSSAVSGNIKYKKYYSG